MMKTLRLFLFALLLTAGSTADVFAQKLKTQELILENTTPNSVSLIPPTGAFTNYKLAFPSTAATVNQVLTVTSIGGTVSTTWANASSLIKAANGLSINGDSVELGGTLYKATTIANGGNNLTYSGTGSLIVNATGGLILGGGVVLNTDGSDGTTGQILRSRGTGSSPQWVNVGSLVKAANGLSMNGDSVELGGTLYKATTIANGGNNLTYSGSGSLNLDATGGLVFGTSVELNTDGSDGTLNQILRSRGTGNSPQWVDVSSLVLASNGLNKDGDTVQLGGTLNQATTISTQSGNNLIVDGAGSLNVSATGGLVLGTGVELNTDGSDGTLNQILRSRGTGSSPQWVDASSLVLASNGLNKDGDTVQLGGTLNQNTSVALGGHDLSLTGTGNVAITQFTSAGIVKNNASGVLSSGKINLADNTNEVTGVLGVTNGGTGVSAIPGNGTILIGNGAGYTLGTITGGTGISVNNGPGTITISSSILDPGTTNNSTLRWNTATSRWTENTNILSTAAGNLSVAAGVTFSGTTSPLNTRGTDGNNNQILRSRGAGASPEWVDVSSLVLASNGLSKDGDTVQLGGTLNEPTTISTQATNNLTLDGAGSFNMSATGGLVLGTGVELNTNGSDGTLNQILRSRGTGSSPEWININSLVLASNGLSKDGDTVQLGGTLNEPTTITTQAANDLTIAGGGDLNVSTATVTFGSTTELNTNASPGADEDVLVSRGAGASPEWKSMSSFFISGRVACTGALTQSITGLPPTVTATSKVIVTYEDTTVDAPIVAIMLSAKGAGSFSVNFTGAPSSTTGFINYIVIP